MFPHPWGVLVVAEMKTPCCSWLCIPQTLLQPPAEALELFLPAGQLPLQQSVLQGLWPALEMPQVCHGCPCAHSPCAVPAAHPWQLGVLEPGAAAAFGAAVSQPPPERCEEQRRCFYSLFHTPADPRSKAVPRCQRSQAAGLGKHPWVRAGHRLCVSGGISEFKARCSIQGGDCCLPQVNSVCTLDCFHVLSSAPCCCIIDPTSWHVPRFKQERWLLHTLDVQHAPARVRN